MQDEVIASLRIRRGHFVFESGHHGDLWLDLESLFRRPALLRPFVRELASRVSRHGIGATCGPATGGAILARMVAAELGVEDYPAERHARPPGAAGPPVAYRVSSRLRGKLAGKRVAVVDDAINAGSAVRATVADLQDCQAEVGAIGALLVLGSQAERLAADWDVPLEGLAFLPNQLWLPAACPLCSSGTPLWIELPVKP